MQLQIQIEAYTWKFNVYEFIFVNKTTVQILNSYAKQFNFENKQCIFNVFVEVENVSKDTLKHHAI